MERGIRVGSNAFLPRAESSEILSCFGDDIAVKLNHYPSLQLSSYAYV